MAEFCECPCRARVGDKSVCLHDKIALLPGQSARIVTATFCNRICQVRDLPSEKPRIVPLVVENLRPRKKAPRVHPQIPEQGPGTELKALLAERGINPETALPKGCGGSCERWVRRMNAWGLQGCKNPKNREKAVKRLKKMNAKTSWAVKFFSAWKTLQLASQFVPNPLDVEGSFYDEAVRRWEVKCKGSSST